MLDKKTIRKVGLAFTTLFLICGIISIILAGISYRFAGPDWKPNPWMHIPALQIASVLYAIFIAFVGFFVFSSPNIAFTIAYSVFLMISILFTFAIAILTLIAGSHGFVNTYFGCNGKFSGILEVWQGVDIYLQKVDQSLCSQQCPCNIANPNVFSSNITVSPFYNLWTKTNNYGSSAFQNCTSLVQLNAYTQSKNEDNLFDPEGNFNTALFANYMGRVETQFQCTGWCNVTYVDTNLGSTTTMYKYLFTDINRGPVQNLGCLNQIINWLPPYLHAWGSTMMVLAGFQCWARERDHELQIPHHHDDDRK